MSERLQSAAVPEQMRAMQSLGFTAETTRDYHWCEWAGHGITLTLPSDVKMNVGEAVRAVLGAAKKAGIEEARAEMRRALGMR